MQIQHSMKVFLLSSPYFVFISINISFLIQGFSNAGLSFTYQLLYLLDATGFYSVGLHALGIHVCRATGQELVKYLAHILILSRQYLHRSGKL